MSMYFQKSLQFPIVNILIRKKETQPQAQFKSSLKRYLNLKGHLLLI